MRKETFHILRDPRSLYLALGMPVVLIILFGYAITLDVRNIPMAVIDQDNTRLSRDLISRFAGSDYFDIRYRLTAASRAEELLNKGNVKVILGVPHDFSLHLSRSQDVHVQLLIDGSDSNTAQIALGYVSGIIQLFSSQIVLEKRNRQNPQATAFLPFTAEPRVWYNPDLRSTNFIVPGLIAVVMMVIAAMMTSLTIAREWEVGTMEQLIATPARPYEIIIGKLLPYYILGLIQTTVVILIGTLLFGVPLKGNIFFLFCVSSLFLICSLSIGLLISTVTRSQQLAFMMSVLFTFLPSFLLSGFVFPISSMPKIVQFFTYLVPARYFLVVLRGLFLKGTGLAFLWPEVLSLFVFAAVILLASSKRMRLNLE
jgi:ABC-2 type transport system permease protein